MSNRAHLNSIIKSNFHQLQNMLMEFSQMLKGSVVEQRIYQLPLTKIEDAKDEPEVINIINIFGNDDEGLAFMQKAFTTLKLDAITYSTYLAHRYPGYIVLPEDMEHEVNLYIDEINRRKAEFHLSVKAGFSGRQSAHKNLHKLIENVVLLSATRKLRSCNIPIHTLSFYWQHKSIHKAISIEEAKNILEKSKDNPTFEYAWAHRDEKLDMIQKELEQLNHIPKNHRIVEINQTRTQPFVDLWTRSNQRKSNKKVSTYNATLPVILFGEPPRKINNLTDYCREMVQFKDVGHTLINARKSWYAVPEK
ncbi:DNA replication terminus site-binding protein [Shewanella frigidimarina]|uniref:DNA replication terminus site-binding protein n=1 Tax=Shewanella frigidimarina TaxID=56812 RepID=UPI003D79F592